MSKHHDNPTTTAARACGTISAVVRFGGLVMAALLASMFWVDLPMPSGRGATDHLGEPYVPASDRWIELGTPPADDSPALTTPSETAAPSPAARQRSARDTARGEAQGQAAPLERDARASSGTTAAARQQPTG